jgi:hypothetical protein
MKGCLEIDRSSYWLLFMCCLLFHCEHAFQGDQRPSGHILFDVDLIDDGSLNDVF